MSSSLRGAVVVGYNGGASSECALEWGAREAVLTGRRLHLLHAWQSLPPGATQAMATSTPDSDAVLEVAAEHVRRLEPEAQLSQRAIEGPAFLALIEASRDAHALVIGAHGRMRRRVSDLGSTGWQVASHAMCPVVVVRNPRSAHQRPPVVIGVGGSRTSDAAVSYGFVQASRRGAPLVAVYGWHLDSLQASRLVLQSDTERDLEDVCREAQLESWVQPWRETFPQVPVRLVTTMWHPADLLLEQASAAQLLVVGRRSSQGSPGLLLESVGFDVLRQAPCPLAIVPADSGWPDDRGP